MIKIMLVLSFGVSILAQADLSGRDIMVKNEEARRLKDCVAQGKLSTSAKGSTPRVKDFTWWRKLDDDGVHYSTLTRFHFPPEVKGEGILFREHDQSQNDIQLYLPNFKKIRRVETDQQSSSFMGSEFSYSDITSPHVDDYKYDLKKEEKCPLTFGSENGDCFVMSSIPATDDVKERTGSKSAVSWIKKDNFMTVKITYTDLDGKEWKVLEAGQIVEVKSDDHKWMAMHIKMENLKTQKTTDLQFSNVRVDKSVPESTFSEQNLAKEK